MKSTLSFALFLLSLLAAQAVSASTTGITNSKAFWDKHELEVCFYDGEPLPYENKIYFWKAETLKRGIIPKAIRKIMEGGLTAAYTPSTTGIFFSGFKACEKSRIPDVVIYDGSSGDENLALTACKGICDPAKPIQAILFDSSFLSDTKIYQVGWRLTLRGWIPSYGQFKKDWVIPFIQQAIVHEAGHIAGLDHEFLRNDVFDEESKVDFSADKRIARVYENRRLKERPSAALYKILKIEDPFEEIGKYDASSTMSYSWSDRIADVLFIQGFCAAVERGNAVSAMKEAELEKIRMHFGAATTSGGMDLAYKKICDPARIQFLLPGRGHQKFLSDGDIETLASIYLKRSVSSAWYEKNMEEAAWFKEASG